MGCLTFKKRNWQLFAVDAIIFDAKSTAAVELAHDTKVSTQNIQTQKTRKQKTTKQKRN